MTSANENARPFEIKAGIVDDNFDDIDDLCGVGNVYQDATVSIIPIEDSEETVAIASNKARAQIVNAILIDLRLSHGRSGFRVSEKLREAGVIIPLIAYSNYRLQELDMDIIELFQRGFSDYLSKDMLRNPPYFFGRISGLIVGVQSSLHWKESHLINDSESEVLVVDLNTAIHGVIRKAENTTHLASLVRERLRLDKNLVEGKRVEVVISPYSGHLPDEFYKGLVVDSEYLKEGKVRFTGEYNHVSRAYEAIQK